MLCIVALRGFRTFIREQLCSDQVARISSSPVAAEGSLPPSMSACLFAVSTSDGLSTNRKVTRGVVQIVCGRKGGRASVQRGQATEKTSPFWSGGKGQPTHGGHVASAHGRSGETSRLPLCNVCTSMARRVFILKRGEGLSMSCRMT